MRTPPVRPTRIARTALAALTGPALLILLLAAPGPTRAAATTDGSAGAVQTLSGRFTVPQSLGTVRGANLLHSFARFGIARGEAATFTTQDAGLRHVIARVTGGQASVLEGPLQLQAAGGASPDFWLLNPSGVLVGAGASFDVPAGLHLGAASTIRFADGSRLDADASSASSLSVAAPEAFGFLAAPAAGLLSVRDAALQPGLGAALTLAGGTMQVERAQIATLAAPLHLHTTGALVLGAGAELSASGVGPGALLHLEAGQMAAAQGAMASAWNYGSATGSGLQVDVAAALVLAEGANLASYAVADGMAGPLQVNAGSLMLSGRGAAGPTSLLSMGQAGPPGAVTLRVAETIEMFDGASIGSSNRSGAVPGVVSVQARRIALDGQGVATTINSLSTGDGPAAAVEVRAGEQLALRDGGQVFGATLGGVDAGSVHIASPRIEMQGGSGDVTGIYANALGAGRGGAITVDTDALSLRDGARISTSTNHALGSAGSIAVNARQLRIEGRGQSTSIDSYAYGTGGDAGRIELQVQDELALQSGATVAAGTFGSGNPGLVKVRAGTLLIDGRGGGQGITAIAGDALFSGAGAEVDVQAARIDILEGGAIATSTASARDGQPLRVAADTLRIDGGANPGTATGIFADTQGSGNAGSLRIEVGELQVLNEGMVSTSTIAAGQGGSLEVRAARVLLSGAGGLVSVAADQGDAGRISIQSSGSVELRQGGYIVANSGGAGASGDIEIRTARFTAEGSDPAGGQRSRIAGRALPDSSGRAGRITLVADGEIVLGTDALLSIANDAHTPAAAQGDSRIRVQGGRIVLDGAEITAAAGAAADAGAIELASTGAIGLSGAGLHTSAASGRGGPITIDAGGALVLRNSLVTTSVLARDGGDGGDIRITTPALALASGFVQANTAAARASGGTVTIDAARLVPDGNHVFVGGQRIADFRPDAPGHNVIQAAAPDGVAGRLDVTQPELNLSGSLAALIAQPVDFGLLRPDICDAGTDSSFTILGRGALPAPASAPLRSR